MKLNRDTAILIAVFILLLPLTAFGEWPTRPIEIIVPWGAGGVTDTVTRLTADAMEEALGQEVVVVNQPGASGSVGSKSALDADRDGYTWTAGAVGDLGSYIVKGLLDTRITDWHIYTNIYLPQVISVATDSPYITFADLMDAFKKNPGKIKVATGGKASASYVAIETIKAMTGIEYTQLTYDSGEAAVISTVTGETDMVPQLSVEEAAMIVAGKLRPLAVFSSDPLQLAGYGEIPPISNWLDGFSTSTFYFGIFVPRGVPTEVIEKMDKIWKSSVSKDEKLITYAAEKGAIFSPAWGDNAQSISFAKVQENAWLAFDTGESKVSPDRVGIPRLKPNETLDTDGDGVGDNSDVFPNDPSESADTDGDGIGDNAEAAFYTLEVSFYSTLDGKKTILSWIDIYENEVSFIVERSTNGIDAFEQIADLGPNTTSYSENTPEGLDSYYYRVKVTF